MESDDEDAPESIIPASSPESNVGDANPRFPHLREPKEEETERAISPIIPVIPRTAIPGITQQSNLKQKLPPFLPHKSILSVINQVLFFLAYHYILFCHKIQTKG